jgi:hypothetical protein
LIDAHELRRRCLGKLSLADSPVDPNYQSSFDQVFAGIGQAEVGEYVARARLLPKGLSFRHSSPHFSPAGSGTDPLPVSMTGENGFPQPGRQIEAACFQPGERRGEIGEQANDIGSLQHT